MTSLSNGLASAAGAGWPPRSGNFAIHALKQTRLSKGSASRDQGRAGRRTVPRARSARRGGPALAHGQSFLRVWW